MKRNRKQINFWNNRYVSFAYSLHINVVSANLKYWISHFLVKIFFLPTLFTIHIISKSHSNPSSPVQVRISSFPMKKTKIKQKQFLKSWSNLSTQMCVPGLIPFKCKQSQIRTADYCIDADFLSLSYIYICIF